MIELDYGKSCTEKLKTVLVVNTWFFFSFGISQNSSFITYQVYLAYSSSYQSTGYKICCFSTDRIHNILSELSTQENINMILLF